MQSLHKATGLPYTLTDNQGNVLVHAGWQDICAKFHRQNPITCGRCLESDRHIINHLGDAPYVGYRCPQGLSDYAPPVVIEGEHVASVFTGQVLTEAPDIEFFEKQADQYGFDKRSYMQALKKVPIVSEERIEAVMAFLVELAHMLASNGLNRLRQREAEQELRSLTRQLTQVVKERTIELSDANDQLQKEVEEHKLTEKALSVANVELRKNIEEVSALHERVQELAIHDPLTGLYNRRFLDETLPRMLSQALRLNYPVTVAMADVDHFKELNDLHGHQAGDKLLKWIASILQTSTRTGDIACRFGGEEFLLVFAGMQLADARERLEQVRASIANEYVSFGFLKLARTISIGIACFPEHADTPQSLIGAADEALYCAKHLGRNRVAIYRPKPAKAAADGGSQRP